MKMNQWNEKAAGKIAEVMVKLQTMFAVVMEKFIARLPLRKVKILLIVFCIASGGFSIWLMVDGIFFPSKREVMKVGRMKVPGYLNKDVELKSSKLDEELIRKIQRHQQVMDSMGVKVSEGLADSIKLINQSYETRE